MNFGEAKSASTKDLSMWVMHSHTMPEKKRMTGTSLLQDKRTLETGLGNS